MNLIHAFLFITALASNSVIAETVERQQCATKSSINRSGRCHKFLNPLSRPCFHGRLKGKQTQTSEERNFTSDTSNYKSILASYRGGASSATTTVAQSSSRQGAVLEGLKSALSSGMAAGCVKTILAPLDTVKTIQQQHKGREALTLMKAGRSVVDRSGIGGLYAGLGVTVLGSMPSVGLYFGVYAYSKKRIGALFEERCDGELSGVAKTFTIAASAAIGNTVASCSRVPYEVVKQKLQTGQYPSTLKALTGLYQTSGFRAFFPLGGISSQMARDIPYAIFSLLCYERLREQWIKPTEAKRGGKPSQWRNMVTGGFSGGLSSFLTNPMDVIKTRLQTNAGAYPGGIIECCAKTWESEGHMAFMKGVVPRLMHKVPANALFFVFYEVFRRVLHCEDVRISKEVVPDSSDKRKN